jgi:hypothetical protein
MKFSSSGSPCDQKLLYPFKHYYAYNTVKHFSRFIEFFTIFIRKEHFFMKSNKNSLQKIFNNANNRVKSEYFCCKVLLLSTYTWSYVCRSTYWPHSHIYSMILNQNNFYVTVRCKMTESQIISHTETCICTKYGACLERVLNVCHLILAFYTRQEECIGARSSCRRVEPARFRHVLGGEASDAEAGQFCCIPTCVSSYCMRVGSWSGDGVATFDIVEKQKFIFSAFNVKFI